MTAREIAARLAARAEEVCEHLLPNGAEKRGEWRAGSVGGESGNSLHVTLSGDRAGLWYDFGESGGGNMLDLWMKARGMSLGSACEDALNWLQVPESERNENRQLPAVKRLPERRAPSELWVNLQKRMRPGTFSELRALAEHRKIPAIVGLELATEAGQLWFADIHDYGFDYPAWLLTDGSRRNAQARKLDGSLWEIAKDAKPCKAKTISGCEAKWPVGITEVGDRPHIFLVEGGPDLLAAWHMIWAANLLRDARPVALFGVSNSIHEEALPLFKGKHVRIHPHNEPSQAGLKGAIQWRRQLKEAGAASVNFYEFTPYGVKDLNDFAAKYGIP